MTMQSGVASRKLAGKGRMASLTKRSEVLQEAIWLSNNGLELLHHQFLLHHAAQVLQQMAPSEIVLPIATTTGNKRGRKLQH